MNTPDTSLDLAQATLLDLRLDGLKRELATFHAPDALEDALAARFRQQRRAVERPKLWWMPPLALAATIALVSWTIRMPVAPVDPLAEAVIPGGAASESDPGPFLALKPLERPRARHHRGGHRISARIVG
jgi:hypothetical protein